jgi:hypothetical protein
MKAAGGGSRYGIGTDELIGFLFCEGIVLMTDDGPEVGEEFSCFSIDKISGDGSCKKAEPPELA